MTDSSSGSLIECPKCGNPADNGHDRCLPPNPYYCTKCEAIEQPDNSMAARIAWSEEQTKEQPDDSFNFNPIEAHKDLKSEALALLREPVVQSLLYDINLLPEQITEEKHWFYMLSVLSHMQSAMKQESVADGFSYEDKGKQPYVFLQWKGTDACFDFHCDCGAHCHFDGDFAYTVKCPHCKTVWEMPFNLFPRKANEKTLEYWRENPQLLEEDENMPLTNTTKIEGGNS